MEKYCATFHVNFIVLCGYRQCQVTLTLSGNRQQQHLTLIFNEYNDNIAKAISLLAAVPGKRFSTDGA